jgi:uncharacterized protein (TIGR00369 family)
VEAFSGFVSEPFSLEAANAVGKESFPGHMGIKFTSVNPERVEAELEITSNHMAPNGFLHGASVVALADTIAGFANVLNLPKGASGFTTIELKTNYLGTAREGVIKGIGTPVHLGKSTQVWDVEVIRAKDNKTIAHFRCTNMILWPDKTA